MWSDTLSIGSLFVSLLALYMASKQFVRNNRPFVWAGSGIFPKQGGGFENAPSVVFFRVINAPAKIVKVIITIFAERGARKLFEVKLENLIRHPDDKVQWTYVISDNEFNKIIAGSNPSSLVRSIQIDYTALDSDKLYTTTMKQGFNNSERQWKDEKESAT